MWGVHEDVKNPGKLMLMKISPLTHYMPLVSFYTHWKHQTTKDFLLISGGTERDHQYPEMVKAT